MRIKRLEICGFKSFVDRTVLSFNDPITGVVGPNGCGKSNIVDAIRWVMGEQSAKHLRGRAMEDVIFNGSESRGPAGMAEVSLTFDARSLSPESAPGGVPWGPPNRKRKEGMARLDTFGERPIRLRAKGPLAPRMWSSPVDCTAVERANICWVESRVVFATSSTSSWVLGLARRPTQLSSKVGSGSSSLRGPRIAER